MTLKKREMFALFFLALASAKTAPRAQQSNDIRPQCLTCKMVVKIVEKYLKDGKKVDEIVKKVETYCQYVAEDVRSICDQLVEEKIPEIIAYIEKQIETHDVCNFLDYCK